MFPLNPVKMPGMRGLNARLAMSKGAWLVLPSGRRGFSSTNFNKNMDYYGQLGLTSTATQDDIKMKFYELAKKHHPDSAQSRPTDEEKFKQITAAYDVLSNM
mmetsp:Transcript_4231/g.5648  ORF Transcript_4231/g.5648 Transcript_4231/m.5648 type:complete len:102 (-) Transcript_4231:925-1230(-)